MAFIRTTQQPPSTPSGGGLSLPSMRYPGPTSAARNPILIAVNKVRASHENNILMEQELEVRTEVQDWLNGVFNNPKSNLAQSLTDLDVAMEASAARMRDSDPDQGHGVPFRNNMYLQAKKIWSGARASFVTRMIPEQQARSRDALWRQESIYLNDIATNPDSIFDIVKADGTYSIALLNHGASSGMTPTQIDAAGKSFRKRAWQQAMGENVSSAEWRYEHLEVGTAAYSSIRDSGAYLPAKMAEMREEALEGMADDRQDKQMTVYRTFGKDMGEAFEFSVTSGSDASVLHGNLTTQMSELDDPSKWPDADLENLKVIPIGSRDDWENLAPDEQRALIKIATLGGMVETLTTNNISDLDDNLRLLDAIGGTDVLESLIPDDVGVQEYANALKEDIENLKDGYMVRRAAITSQNDTLRLMAENEESVGAMPSEQQFDAFLGNQPHPYNQANMIAQWARLGQPFTPGAVKLITDAYRRGPEEAYNFVKDIRTAAEEAGSKGNLDRAIMNMRKSTGHGIVTFLLHLTAPASARPGGIMPGAGWAIHEEIAKIGIEDFIRLYDPALKGVEGETPSAAEYLNKKTKSARKWIIIGKSTRSNVLQDMIREETGTNISLDGIDMDILSHMWAAFYVLSETKGGLRFHNQRVVWTNEKFLEWFPQAFMSAKPSSP